MKPVFLFLAFCGILFRASSQPQESIRAVSLCDAAFTATPDTANPLLMRFEDHSTGSITLWQWSFGDGVTSTLRHPEHLYPAGGTYFVCLTVSSNDSVNPCHDVLCIALTIHEPGTCVADYSYATDPGNSLRVNFTDKSTGGITHRHWDFGDGTVSEEQNPVHVFPGYGDFRVCLTGYNPDSMATCNDVRCDTIALSPALPCKATFTNELDSLNPKPNTFLFYSTSTGDPNGFTWRFDDGAVYHTANVTHTFSDPGTHEVCLKIKKEDQGVMVCSDSVCHSVTTPGYFNIGGHCFAGSLPINNPVSTGDTGIAFLYRMKGSQWVLLDTCRFTRLGYFAFPQTLSGHYLIRTELTPGSANRDRFFPGYYNQSLYWYEAPRLTIAGGSNYGADIRMLPACDTLYGQGKMTGKVVRAFPGPGSADLPDATVILLDGEWKPVRYTLSGPHGEFSLDDLPFGTYYLRVEYTGFWSRTTMVWVDSTAPVANNLLLEVFDKDVTSVEEPVAGLFRAGDPFPNPGSGGISLPVDCRKEGLLTLKIRTLTGYVVWSGTIRCPAGKNMLSIPDFQGPPGICLLIMTGEGEAPVVVKKLVRF